jgi:hypothetical protein
MAGRLGNWLSYANFAIAGLPHEEYVALKNKT